MSAPGAFASPDMSRLLTSSLVVAQSCHRRFDGVRTRARHGEQWRGCAGPVFSDTGPDAGRLRRCGRFSGWHPDDRESARTPGRLRTAISAKCFPSRQVRRCGHTLAASSGRRSRRSPYSSDPERRSIADYLSHNPTTGLLIAKDDTILYEHYQYARTDRDRLLSQSMAKTITVDADRHCRLRRQRSSRSTILSRHMFPASAWRLDIARRLSGTSCTCRQASPFRRSGDGQDDISRLSRDLFGESGKQIPSPASPGSTRALRFRREPNGTTPAARRRSWAWYCAPPLVSRFADYLHGRIWDAIGAEADAAWAIDGTGQEIAFCCFNATLRDYARLGRLLAHDGAWEGRQLIPRQWLLDATHGEADRRSSRAGNSNSILRLWIPGVASSPGEQRRFALLGIRGQTILVDPATKLVMVHTAVRKKPSRTSALMPSRLRCGSPCSGSLDDDQPGLPSVFDAAARLEVVASPTRPAVTARQWVHALSGVLGRYHRPHVVSQFAVMLAEAQI